MSLEVATAVLLSLLRHSGIAVVVQTTLCSIFLITTEILAPVFFSKRRIQPGTAKFPHLRHELIHAFVTLVSGGIIGYLLETLKDSGHIVLDETGPCTADNTTAQETIGGDFPTETNSCTVSSYAQFGARIALEVFGYFVLFDAYFYWGHRLFHTPALYFLHRPHHVSTAPNAVAAFSFNPVEGTIFGAFFPFSLLAWTWIGGGFHFYSMVLMGFLQGLQSLLIHSGYEFFPAWVFKYRLTAAFLTPTFHDRHHEFQRCNFAGFFTWWDDLCGTNDGDDWRNKYHTWYTKGRRARPAGGAAAGAGAADDGGDTASKKAD